MRFKHKIKQKEGDTRVYSRFAFFPVTALTQDSVETRWLEKVTTKQQLVLINVEEDLTTLKWQDVYFIDN